MCLVQIVTYILLLAAASSDCDVPNRNDNKNSDMRSIEELSGPELASRMTVGARVVRGKDWIWENQDGGAGNEGTVVRGVLNGWVQVEWDSGFANSYRMGHEDKFELNLAGSSSATVTTTPKNQPSTTTEPKISSSELSALFKVGTRVVRGKDWDWDDQDGGAGNEGTVVREVFNGWLKVMWDSGITDSYRLGFEDKYDLSLAESSSDTVTTTLKSKPPTVSDKSEISAPELATLFKVGTRVVRGRDWDWDDQDGGEGGEGEIITINRDKQWVGVRWDSGGENRYSVGYKGKYDLKVAPETTRKSDITTTRSSTPITSPRTWMSTVTTIAKDTASVETVTQRSMLSLKADNNHESIKLFGQLIVKEISRVPQNDRIQVFQDILEVFKKYNR